MNHRDDPDETEGRQLYRARADALARAQVAMSKRRVRTRPFFECPSCGKDIADNATKHGAECDRIRDNTAHRDTP